MKKPNKLIFLMSLGLGILSTSCVNENMGISNDKTDGKIQLNVTTDASVSEGTRADDVSPLVPNAKEFSVSLKSKDGSYNQTWKSLDAFNSEVGFPMGSYTISAAFGDMDSEGFNNPYFYGESSVNVLKGESSNVDITATLANAMLSIRYKEEFYKFFKGYSATVTTEGHSPIVFLQNERKPAYISANYEKDAIINLTITNNSDQTVTISPTSFKVEPQKHYIVTFGVEGNIDLGDATLSVEWSEETVSEEKNIPLNEELFTSPAPTVTIEGTENFTKTIFEGLDYNDYNPEFHIVALGGLASATLSFKAEDNGTLPISFPSIDLVKADNTDQLLLKNGGIECSGIFGDPQPFAVVNLKEFVKYLTPGTYSVSLTVTDIYGRSIEEPVKFEVTINGLEYKFLSYEQPDFLSDEIIVYVETNCKDLKDQLLFNVWDTKENFVNPVSAEFVSDLAPDGPSATKEFVYTYKLVLPDAIDNYFWKVQTQIPNKKVHEIDVDVNMPEFKVETDAFAMKVRIRLAEGTSEKIANTVANYGKIYNGSEVLNVDLSGLKNNGIITVTSLNPKTDYNYTLNLGKSLYEKYKNNMKFTTEEDKEVPNGDFESLISIPKYTNKKVNQGGGYGSSSLDLVTYTNTSTYTIKEPEGWATTNQKTIDGGTNNTWFSQPSVFNSSLSYKAFCDFRKRSDDPGSYTGFAGHGESANAMVIRNVAWSPNGTVPLKTGKSLTYYNTRVPTISNVSVGKMFLGEYSYTDGTEIYNDSIEFNSRPSKLKGFYIFTPDQGDTSDYGVVEVKLFNNNTLVASGQEELEACVNYSDFIINLEYQTFGLKANKLMIMVSSSKYGSKKMIDETSDKIKTTKYQSEYESYFYGATLVVDDFTFEY